MPNDLVERPSENTAVAVADGPGSLLTAIVAMAKDPAVDVEKLSALLAMQERLEARQAESAYNSAFSRLQMKLPRVKKNGQLSHLGKDGAKGGKVQSFAKWEDIDEAIRPLLDEEGFSLSFDTAPKTGDGGGLIVTAILRHQAGHSTRTAFPVPLDNSGGKNSLQGYGSSLSYGKRYAATAALNIVTEDEDDDGKRGGARFISADHVDELRHLIVQTSTDDARFCQFLGVASIENIEAGGFAPAKNMLLSKMKKGAQS